MKKIFLLSLLLSVVTLGAQEKPLKSIKVAKGPYFAAPSQDGSRVFVTSFAESEIQIVDSRTHKATQTFYGGFEPVGIAATPGGDKLFITNLGPGLVKVIDTETLEILDDIKVDGRPANVVMSPNGLQAFVLNFGRGKIGRVDFIDTDTHRISGLTEIGVRPVAGAVSPLGDMLYVVCSGSNDLFAIDANRRTVTKRIPVGLAPDGAAISRDGLTLYVANSGTNDISVIDLLDLTETRRVPVGQKPFSLSIDEAGRLYVVETGDKTISVYNSDFQKIHSYRAKKKPVDVKLSIDGRHVYVTDEEDNRLLVFRAPTG